ncbi:MAG: universal stress protein [Gemmatimonadota bacterium]
MFERILVPLDGSGFGETALPRAIQLAEWWDASLELATVANPEVPGGEPGPPPDVGDDFLDVARQHAREYLTNVEERIRSGGFAGGLAHAVIPSGNIAHSLARHVHERDCDLAVMTTHGRGPIQRAWLGSAADAFIRRSPVPVLLIRPRDEGVGEDGDRPDEASGRPDLTRRPALFRRLLIPLDGSEEAERMLETAAPLISGEAEGECILLRVVAPFMPGGSPYLPHVVREVESQALVKKAAWDYLDGVTDRAPGSRVEGKVVTDAQAAAAILKVAEEEEADVIAMATAGRGGVGRLLLGSVADKVVRGAELPVLVHRETDEG